MEKPVFVTLDPPEKSRTYFYPNVGDPSKPHQLRFENVIAISLRPSGRVRINMADGTKAIAMEGFIGVQIDTPEWTF